MNPADRERVKELLSRAARLPISERAAFIEQAAGGERDIAAEVLDLLPTLDDSAFMSAPTGGGLNANFGHAGVLLEAPGARIGRYKLLQLIGEGGFGSVFMAEQTEPVIRRVALKIIKAGMDTKQVMARFEAERQALAMMDHPNIARVLDAGATESGRPYFVMELVRGEPVTTYCDRERLTVTRRLELFREICHAVQHAHQKGIIHRDLKPTNVLVTVSDGQPLPKVIDFGIAKATAGRLTDKTLFTELHQLIGTPQYMSPEQAEVSGVDIDTRSDIYALGVLLYELLAGGTPLEGRRLRSTPFAEIQRIIREEEPPRPSLRLASLVGSSAQAPLPTPVGAAAEVPDSSAIEIAERRQTDPALLTRALRGDLDWIVMKCLEKDRGRRYSTASALADDIGRVLDHQPVLATPPTAGYKLRKFVRRNRGAVIAGGVIGATLLIAAGVSLAFGLSEARQRRAAESAEREAKTRADELERVAKFQEAQLSGIDAQTMGVRLRQDLLEKARAAATHSNLSPEGVNARVKELEKLIAGSDFTGMALKTLDDSFFEPALRAIEDQFAGQPLVQARLLQTLASTLGRLGLSDAASKPQDAALAIRRRELGDEHADTLSSMDKMGVLLQAQGKFSEAEAYLREALEKRRRVLGEVHADTLESLNNIGGLLWDQRKLDQAEPYFREAMEKCRRVLGDDHLETLTSVNNMGSLLQDQGKLDQAEPYLREAMEKHRRVLGDDHPDTLTSINNMGVLLWKQGKLDQAEPYLREAMEKCRRVLGDDHCDTLRSINNMGVLLWNQGKLDQAAVYLREAMERYRLVLGDDHPKTLRSISDMGTLLQTQGRSVEAIELLALAEPLARLAFTGTDAASLARLLDPLGQARAAIGEFDEASANLTEAFDLVMGANGAIGVDVLTALVKLYDAWHAAEPDQGHDVEAAEWRAKLKLAQSPNKQRF
jgi:serine/threonine protein kinase/tetratricopeptide (TPR) repeat protein